MSLTLKRLIMAAFGLLGACIAWPALSAMQYFQSSFPGYLAFALAQGVVAGMAFGAMFGSLEGIVVSSRAKAIRGLGFGALYGAAAGAVGALSGQLFMFMAGGAVFRTNAARLGPALAVSNGIAWAILGLALAMTEGLRARSGRKLLAGLLGGTVGGMAGGAALSAIAYAAPGGSTALFAGLALFGLCVSVAYAAFENRFSAGALRLLNGPLKDKEYPVVSRRLRIGSDDACDVVLEGYPGVEPLHASLRIGEGGPELVSEKSGARILVNDEAFSGRALRPDDVIAIGKAKFIYGYFG